MRKSEIIRNKILAELLEQGLQPGDPIPSRHRLCRKFNCSRTTVEHAIAKLTDSGFLTSRQGSGTFLRNLKEVRGIEKLYVALETVTNDSFSGGNLAEMLFSGVKPDFNVTGITVPEISARLHEICRPGCAVLWLTPSMSSIHLMDYLDHAGIPQLLINRKYKHYDYAVTDAEASVREGLSWLMIEGGRDITLIAEEADISHPYRYDRILAFFKTAIELGAHLSPDSVLIRNFRNIPEEISEIANKIFHTPSPAKAVFIIGASVSLPFVTAAASLNIAAGFDYKLLCFDTIKDLKNRPGIAMLEQQWNQLYYETLRWIRDGYAVNRLPFHSAIKTKLIKPPQI